jgi:hypothetical protein
MRVDAGAAWWEALPGKLKLFMQAGSKLHASQDQSVLDAVMNAGLATIHQLVKLSNMSAQRAAFILRLMANGKSYADADKASRGVYDLCGWHEILSRLARARGSVLLTAAVLARGGTDAIGSPADETVIVETAKRIEAEGLQLLRTLRSAEADPIAKKIPKSQTPKETLPHLMARKLAGYLRASAEFLAKTNRDLQIFMNQRETRLPSKTELARINVEVACVLCGARLILQMRAASLIGTVAKPAAQGDRYGIGAAYAQWLDPLSAHISPDAVIRVATSKNGPCHGLDDVDENAIQRHAQEVRRVAENHRMVHQSLKLWQSARSDIGKLR